MNFSALARPHRSADAPLGEPTPGTSATAALRPSHGPGRLLRGIVALAIVGGPAGYLVGGLFAPSLHLSGSATIAANVAANPITNTLHVVAFVVASYLLPVGAAGLAWLAYPGAPWLATIGGLLAVVGWLPFSALAALDDLAVRIAQLPAGASYARLLDVFSNDPVMNSYLIVYIVGHLLAAVLLGIALRRSRVMPRWAAAALIASSPLMIAAFALPPAIRHVGFWVAVTSVALLVVGSVPAARRMARGR